ncbi:MAG: helix-turn-helix domain-containing protein [Acidobacteriia bacterium]|nr:helix-turn-helix domain-containing protein [Terriglobia bacterium]
MDIHKNARLSFRSREALVQHVVERALTLKAAAAAFRVTVKTPTKWVQRYRAQGLAGLYDWVGETCKWLRGVDLNHRPLGYE